MEESHPVNSLLPEILGSKTKRQLEGINAFNFVIPRPNYGVYVIFEAGQRGHLEHFLQYMKGPPDIFELQEVCRFQ